jgi:hypothetical protein
MNLEVSESLEPEENETLADADELRVRSTGDHIYEIAS